jgi:hypothetical protein
VISSEVQPAQSPTPLRAAVVALAYCALGVVRLLLTRGYHIVPQRLGLRLRFADGTSSMVFRETVADHVCVDPCLLVVTFRLRFVRGWGHALFRVESILNTILYAGFPGYTSKLWMDHDENGVYRGVYEWDGADRAEHYARCLWRVLAVVSVPGSIGYAIVPHLRRDEALTDPHVLEGRRIADRYRIVAVG